MEHPFDSYRKISEKRKNWKFSATIRVSEHKNRPNSGGSARAKYKNGNLMVVEA